MEEKLFQAPAQIQGISTLKDRTIKFSAYISLELKPEEKAMLFDLEQKEGWFLFKENEIKVEDIKIPDFKPEFRGEKSPCQRQREVLFLRWQKQSPQYRERYPAEVFYRAEMEKKIEDDKAKLND